MMTERQEITGLGSYSRVADALTIHFRLDPPLDRRQIETWHKRRTRNAAGDRPPEPVTELDDPRPRTPHVLFDIAAWKTWMTPGTPAPHGVGFETPEQRNKRYASREERQRQASQAAARRAATGIPRSS